MAYNPGADFLQGKSQTRELGPGGAQSLDEWLKGCALATWGNPKEQTDLPKEQQKPVKEQVWFGDGNSKDIIFSNGDRFSLGGRNGWNLTDKNGNPVTIMERIDKGESTTSRYRLSNGATYYSGCFTDGISYPNGDSISFRSVIWSVKGGKAVAREEKQVPAGGEGTSQRRSDGDSTSGRRQETTTLPEQPSKWPEIFPKQKPTVDRIPKGGVMTFPNGDRFVAGPSGIEWTDSKGNKITRVRRTDSGQIPGNVTYEMSNGATYHSGCFTDNISYPNGDNISFWRSGAIISGKINGRVIG